MKSTDPLYLDCSHNPTSERYGLIRPNDNCFYIIDSNFEVLKNVQLVMMKHEFLAITYIDHFFDFIPKTQMLVDKYQIDSLTQSHNNHVARAGISLNDKTKINSIQRSINNDNCFLFGMSPMTMRSYTMDLNHFRLHDNIIQHTSKPKTFDDDVCSKLFLLRRILYVTHSIHEYLLEFARLQERISTNGLTMYKKHFKDLNPSDNKFSSIIDREIAIDASRFETIDAFIKTVHGFINNIDLNSTIPTIITEFCKTLEDLEKTTYTNTPSLVRSYEAHRIVTILTDDLMTILNHE